MTRKRKPSQARPSLDGWRCQEMASISRIILMFTFRFKPGMNPERLPETKWPTQCPAVGRMRIEDERVRMCDAVQSTMIMTPLSWLQITVERFVTSLPRGPADLWCDCRPRRASESPFDARLRVSDTPRISAFTKESKALAIYQFYPSTPL